MMLTPLDVAGVERIIQLNGSLYLHRCQTPHLINPSTTVNRTLSVKTNVVTRGDRVPDANQDRGALPKVEQR